MDKQPDVVREVLCGYQCGQRVVRESCASSGRVDYYFCLDSPKVCICLNGPLRSLFDGLHGVIGNFVDSSKFFSDKSDKCDAVRVADRSYCPHCSEPNPGLSLVSRTEFADRCKKLGRGPVSRNTVARYVKIGRYVATGSGKLHWCPLCLEKSPELFDPSNIVSAGIHASLRLRQGLKAKRSRRAVQQ